VVGGGFDESGGVMALWRTRELHEDDLDAVVRLWDDPSTAGAAAAFGLSELIAATRDGQPAVVAVVGDQVVGSVVSIVDMDHAWVMRISLAADWRNKGVGSALLEALERRLDDRGVRRISCLLSSDAEVGAMALEHSGFEVRTGMRLYEKVSATGHSALGALSELGGRMLRPGLWESLGGMKTEKELIERRVILPLANTKVADRLGVVPPVGIVLFGPPGTGKTSFAKGIASRLGWPFVELFPSRLGADKPGGLAAALRDAFELVAELDNVVVFIDEVEEIASIRAGGALSAATGVTNEMLKLIPRFREQEGRLLVCATNSIRDLDSAFLRHGRFDYVLPVGPPDAEARASIWERYLASMPHEAIDLDSVVAASDMFTPADIEFAARRTAQEVFEGAVLDDRPEVVNTEVILQAIERTRPTLSARICESFDEDIAEFARL
jgi:GNAT superfamily N-acetyltransferase